MNIKNLGIAIGLVVSVITVPALAAPFSPLAADRYNSSAFVDASAVVEKEPRVELNLESVEPRQSFQPFAANSYKASPFKFRAAREMLDRDSDVQVGQAEGAGFKHFSADRYYK